jgi:hypothetical protein
VEVGDPVGDPAGVLPMRAQARVKIGRIKTKDRNWNNFLFIS